MAYIHLLNIDNAQCRRQQDIYPHHLCLTCAVRNVYNSCQSYGRQHLIVASLCSHSVEMRLIISIIH